MSQVKGDHELRVFIAAHKPIIDKLPEGYELLQVGAKDRLHFSKLSDDMGDNISQKNARYCELTALYWIWKNVNSDFVGMVHYRRFFFRNSWACSYRRIIPKEELLNCLSRFDLIIPKIHKTGVMSVKEQYAASHNVKDIIVTRFVLSRICHEYLEDFDRVMDSHGLHYYNMLISNKEVFDSYMSWVFPILDLLDTQIDIGNYSSYNQRAIGFIAERLFNVWLLHNKNQLSVMQLPVQQVFSDNRMIFINTIRGLVSTLVGMR